jgi:hypothetical protein
MSAEIIATVGRRIYIFTKRASDAVKSREYKPILIPRGMCLSRRTMWLLGKSLRGVLFDKISIAAFRCPAREVKSRFRGVAIPFLDVLGEREAAH